MTIADLPIVAPRAISTVENAGSNTVEQFSNPSLDILLSVSNILYPLLPDISFAVTQLISLDQYFGFNVEGVAPQTISATSPNLHSFQPLFTDHPRQFVQKRQRVFVEFGKGKPFFAQVF